MAGQRSDEHGAGMKASPTNQLAIVPNATHSTLVIDPMLPAIVERFLGAR